MPAAARPEVFHYRGPDALEVRRGSGTGGNLASFVFFGLAWYFASGVEPLGGRRWGTPNVMALGACALLGTLCALGRRGVSLDRAAREMRVWRGLWLPFRLSLRPFIRRRQLIGIEGVRFECRHYTAGRTRQTVYPVILKGGKGEDLELTVYGSHAAARTQAERVAKFLHLGITDASQNPPLHRMAGTLDEPLRERIARAGPPEPALPVARLIVTTGASETVVDCPAHRLSYSDLAALLSGVSFCLLVAYLLVTRLGLQGAIHLPWAGAALGVVGLGIWLLRRERLRLGPSSIGQEVRWLFVSRRRSIPAGELEELESRGDCLIARSDRAVLILGTGLDGEELRWVQDRILCELSRAGKKAG